MKLKMPHKTYILDFELDLVERLEVVNRILADKIDFNGEKMTVNEYFRETWNVLSYKDTTITYKEIIGYYLTKEEKDLSVLSRDKLKEMSRGSKRHTTFSGMGYDNQVNCGLVDPEQYEYN
ncbi:hypothetical protein [Sporosarcina sp. FSL W7-1283]|uniref:hypothetical protein n=1 Tax=Sporosarcina sp. FSL W7-1283 TaxID=2921560 RepID=UPI0030FC430B